MTDAGFVELRVYPNPLNRDEFELLGCEAGITLHEYLCANVPAYYERPVPLFSVMLNNKELPFNCWEKVTFAEGDLVECVIEPKATATIIMAVIAVASAAYAIYISNQPLPDTYNSTTPKGSPIYDVNAQGNRPRLMGTVPVLFGRHKVFPDHLVPPRIEYVGNEQYYYALLSVAAGVVSLSLNDIYIGDTSINAFGSDVTAVIYQPGQNISGDAAYKIVYSSVEVGSNGGTAGVHVLGAMAESDRSKSAPLWQVNPADDPKIIYMVDPVPVQGSVPPVYNRIDWTEVFRDSHGSEGLVSKIVELSSAGANNGYYRIVRSVSASPASPHPGWEFRKQVRTGDVFTQDYSWTGFTGTYIDNNQRNLNAHYRIIHPPENYAWWFGGFSSVPDGETTSKLYLDFRFNNGLCILDSGGTPQSRSVHFEIQWKSGGSGWVTINKVYTAATVSQLAYTETINVPAGSRPEVRVRRITAEVDDIRYKEKMEWVALKSELSSRTSYPEFTILSIKIKGTDAVSSDSNNKIGCIPTGFHKTMDSNGNVISARGTRHVSAAFMKIADDLGYDIDLDALGVLHKKWVARGDTFDGVFDNPTTAWKAMQQVLAAGFTEPTLDFGKIIPIRDEARTALNYQYQADNILPNTWKMDGAFIDDSDHDGVEVEYMSSETWKSETILCLLPGDAGANPEQVRAFGVTSKTQAYRFGMRHRATQKHRRIRHHFSTEMDALNSRYMSYDALGIDMPGYSQTGRVEGVAGTTLQLNQDLVWGDLAATHYIALRRPNGTLSGPYVCSPGATDGIVELTEALDFVPVFNGNHEPPYFMFGTADEWCVPVLVTEIKPSGTDKVKVTAFEYSDDVYLYDNALPPS